MGTVACQAVDHVCIPLSVVNDGLVPVGYTQSNEPVNALELRIRK